MIRHVQTRLDTIRLDLKNQTWPGRYNKNVANFRQIRHVQRHVQTCSDLFSLVLHENQTKSCTMRQSDSQTPEGYISKDIYIPYPIQKSGKRIFSYPFFEWDMLKDIYPYFWDIHIFISYPISFFQYKFELCRVFFFCAI
jgi:hypothetical protein